MHGEAFKEWRLSYGWNQTQAACYLGTSQVNISRWERGVRDIPDTIAQLVYLLSYPTNIWLMENYLLKTPKVG
jgi:transcriptional regulator with XRE-family HTH domain